MQPDTETRYSTESAGSRCVSGKAVSENEFGMTIAGSAVCHPALNVCAEYSTDGPEIKGYLIRSIQEM